MKICRTFLLIIIAIGLMVSKTNAQKNWAQDADRAFTYFQYYEAVGMYKKAYTKVKKNKVEKARIVYQIAECYRLTNDTKQAETWYKKAVNLKYPEHAATLHYAEMLKSNEKYDEAVVQFKAYKLLEPNDPKADNGVESSTLAQQWKDNPTRYEVENMKAWNTKDMDFAPAWYDKKYKQVIFTSSREGSTGKDYDAWTGQNFTDIYLSALDKKSTTWSTPVSVGENINTNYNEGAACLNEKCNELYFTRCGVEKKKQLGCQIYVSKKKGTAWDIPELITLGPDSFSYGHPALSKDELTLYFSSDMTGGYGGKDLWMVKRTKKTKAWEKAVNLGPNINTDGDEMYPYIREDGVLYFASNGHVGMGGLDIFKVEKISEDKWGKPENMKYPINSAADDYAIIFEGKLDKGYFSSNRKGGKGSDDIYSFEMTLLNYTLQGTVCNDSSKTTPKEMIKNALVTLVGSDGTIVTDSTLVDGTYKFSKAQVLPNTSYQITVTAKGFFGAKAKESTVGLEKNKDFVHNFCLTPIPKPPIVLPEIRFGFNDFVLQSQYQDSLNDLIQVMTDNPTLVIELGSHTDARGGDAYNDTLSYKRAKSIVDYLISKGIPAARLKAHGYGKSVPRVLIKDITVNSYVKGTDEVKLKTPIKFTKGTTLNETYINQFSSDEDKFEAAHQLNRRSEFKILSEDFVPSDTIFEGKTPNIQMKNDTTSNKKVNDNTTTPDNSKKMPGQPQNKQQNNKTGTNKGKTKVPKNN